MGLSTYIRGQLDRFIRAAFFHQSPHSQRLAKFACSISDTIIRGIIHDIHLTEDATLRAALLRDRDSTHGLNFYDLSSELPAGVLCADHFVRGRRRQSLPPFPEARGDVLLSRNTKSINAIYKWTKELSLVGWVKRRVNVGAEPANLTGMIRCTSTRPIHLLFTKVGVPWLSM